jgi:hypothetical protein
MADMGIYSLWPVFTGLELDAPASAEAWATHTCTIEDNVSRTVHNDFAYPTGCSLRFRFAERPGRPAVDLFWYDGGMKPRLPEALEVQGVPMEREGILFVGDQGTILGGFHGQNPRLFKAGASRPLWDDVNRSERRPARLGALDLWLRACQGGEVSPGDFVNASAITDAVNLGTVALRAREKVLFDSETMRITNIESANQLLRRDYRPGWEL